MPDATTSTARHRVPPGVDRRVLLPAQRRDHPAAPRRPARAGLARHRLDLIVAALLTGTATLGVVLVSRVITRPLWYDEQWRAYYFSFHGRQFWTQIQHANAPSGLLYVAVEKLSTAAFGQYPWALRLPAAAAVPVLTLVTYAYARRFIAVPGAAFTAVIVGGSSGIIDQALQFKPYLLEAAATGAIMLLWSAARDPGQGARRQRTLLFTGAGVLSCFMVPGIFLIVPLAVAEGLLRRGGVRQRLRAFADASPALVISLLHTGLFVARQSAQRHSNYWNFAFASGRGFGGALHFLETSTRSLAAGSVMGFSAGSTPVIGLHHLGWVAPVVGVLVILGWITAATRLWRERAGRQLLFVVATIFLGTALASLLRLWPYGLVRTNIFAIPLLAVLAVAGWTVWCRAAREAVRSRPHRRRNRGQRRAAVVLPACVLLGVPAAGIALLVLDGARLDQWHVKSRQVLYGAKVTRAAFDVEAAAKPGDLVLYGSAMAIPGWRWALNSAAGAPSGRPRISPADQLGYTSYRDGKVEAALRTRTTGKAFVYVAEGAAVSDAQELGHQFSAAGWCVQSRHSYASSGVLLTLNRCS